jgi:Protein of unknown function (DUF3800)
MLGGYPMAVSFVAYIGESGDEGFVFKGTGIGSTSWLVLSAVIVPKIKDPNIVRLAEKIRVTIEKPKNFVLHFRKLNHDQRVAACDQMAASNICIISILTSKPDLPPDYATKEKHILYRYMCRLLLERISWLCRDHPKPGDGTAKLIFSNRAAMSYDDLRNYLVKLKGGSAELNVKIDWGVIDPTQVSAINHDQLAGLQIADIAASGTRWSVDLNKYNNVESRYIEILRPTFYRYKGKLLGYGLKFFPNLDKIKPSNPHVAMFDGF